VHRNPKFELVDERASGGFVHRQQVTICRQCTMLPPTNDTAKAERM
jgi:hypothetical protein